MLELDKSITSQLNAGMSNEGAVELPFPVVYLWAHNGQASYKDKGGALYYGGWACKAEDADALIQSTGLPLPQGWKKVLVATRDGGEFEAYTSRSIIVAPFAKRVSWIKDGRRSPVYEDGARRHVQVLAYLADQFVEGNALRLAPWGPVVLTAKGYQARNLIESLDQWSKATSSLRLKVAPGIPAWCFYMSLGTFGKERVAMNVGKPGAQSPITPISVYIPEGMTEENFAGRFVGKQVAGQMVELLNQSKEWLGAWQQAAEETAGHEQISGNGDYGLPPEEGFPF